MEQKMIRVPFDMEAAKRITNGEIEGRVVTRAGSNARIVCWDAKGDSCIVALIDGNSTEQFPSFNYPDGLCFRTHTSSFDLFLEIPENSPYKFLKPQFLKSHEHPSFKDGDVLICGGVGEWIFIYKENGYVTGYYVALNLTTKELDFASCSYIAKNERIKKLNSVTEAEKQKLIDALKASDRPEAKEYLKRFFGIETENKYSQYKDGDILRAYDNIVIINKPYVDNDGWFNFKQYAAYCCTSNELINIGGYYNQQEVRYATDEERETIKRAMLESGNPLYDGILKKWFDIEKPEFKFKPFDRVLARQDDKDIWSADFFSFMDGKEFNCIGGLYYQCIPYNEQTKHLLGTTDSL